MTRRRQFRLDQTVAVVVICPDCGGEVMALRPGTDVARMLQTDDPIVGRFGQCSKCRVRVDLPPDADLALKRARVERRQVTIRGERPRRL